jgi:transposase
MTAIAAVPPAAWRPLSLAEFELLRGYLPAPRTGRRPADLRRTLDAVFWMACSTGPWAALPQHFGKAGTVHRALTRWARAGVLDRLAFAVARRVPGLAALAWFICRAFRRMARILPLAAVGRAQALGLKPALPSDPVWLPAPGLSTSLRRLVSTLLCGVDGLEPLVVGSRARAVRAAMTMLGHLRNPRRGWTLK